MAKYSVVRLTVDGQRLLGIDRLSNNEKKALSMQNAIYIYRGTKSKKVYIGQTVHFTERHKQHYNGTEEKFNTAGFDRVMIIFSKDVAFTLSMTPPASITMLMPCVCAE